jgi:hypothetical protein
MNTLKKVNQNTFTKDLKNPYPIYGDRFNETVDDIQENFDETQAAVDVIEALNATIGGTTSVTNTQKVLVSLTSANLLAMNGTPVTVIAAKGEGTAIRIKSCTAIFDSTGTTYANGGVIYLSYSGAATTPITNNLAASFLTAGDKVYSLNALTAASGYSLWSNSAVVITNDTAAFITGTGVARLLIDYDVITTGL